MLEHLDTLIGFATVMLLLSLLVTTVVQMVAGLSNLRGRCLLEGTEQLLKQLDPGLKDQARALARKVLTHSAIGEKAASLRDLLPGRLRRVAEGLPRELAVAIRPRELILVLKDLSEDATVEEDVRNKLKALFTSTPGQGSPEMIAKAEELLKKLEGQFPNQAQDLKSAVESVLKTSQTIVVKVDAWFDTVMDRTSEVFKYYTRQITVVVSVLFALLLHIDSLAIFNQLSQNEDLRANLVQMSGSVVTEGEKVLAPDGSDLATQALQALAQDKTQPEVAQAVSALCTGQAQCANLKNRSEGRSVLQRIPEDQKAGALKAYEDTYTKVAKERMSALGVSLDKLQDYLTDTKLEIIPTPICLIGHLDFRSLSGVRPCFMKFKSRRNLLGVIVTAFLLSLGAPFWYNALRKLSDLRPIVARRVDGEPLKGAPKEEKSNR
jgi:hypothetical protein